MMTICHCQCQLPVPRLADECQREWRREREEVEVVLFSDSVARVCTSSIIIKSRSDGGESPGNKRHGHTRRMRNALGWNQ